jgi:exo-1,4-beta-D-glucosaminidase
MRSPSAGCLAVFATAISTTTLAKPFTPFPSWNVTSSAGLTENATKLSLPGIDTSSWHHLNASKGTLMATLIASGVYNEDELFYSNNLKTVDSDQFRVPWFYRSESTWENSNIANKFYTLRTNGISSRADIYLNGHLVADKDMQAGAYAGLEYDVTDKVRLGGSNVLLVKAYPTDYDRDFALGFVDWNPYPPDNGTGVWRDVELKRTGQVSLSTPRVVTTLDGAITVYVDAKNLAKNATASGCLDCFVYDPQGISTGTLKNAFDIAPGAQTTLSVQAKIANPQLWWPRQWGSQPLYSIQCSAFIHNTKNISDITPLTKFGIRTVTSTLDTTHNDTTFHINSHPFQVLGAGYTSDIFLRFSESKLRTQLQYVLDMGLNTVRLEGKQEHPGLYEMCDEMGIMILAGWECCDKWEGWSFNDEGSGAKWDDADYSIANASMRHEAGMMQPHPSMLGFLVGSDFWPDDRATNIYLAALRSMNWDTPILASASQRGAPVALGNGGMKMDGPYDWVPPNYWYDTEQRLGSAGGFGSELGAGVGTPSLPSLERFLSKEDLDDLWTEEGKEKGLYHMSTNVSSFYTRTIYNDALWARYGKPTSLDDYLRKSQIMDYEATKSQFEAYLSRWNTNISRPATGMIYWMLNNAWPSLHWSLFDYYLERTAAYFGTKAALSNLQHVVFDFESRAVYLIDRRLPLPFKNESLARTIGIELIDVSGTSLYQKRVETSTQYNSAQKIAAVPTPHNTTGITFLRLTLTSPTSNETLSTNIYTLAPTLDIMDWDNSTWYHTPVTSYADYRGLWDMKAADVEVHVEGRRVVVRNKGGVPAVGVRLSVDGGGGRWSDNWMTIWDGEKKVVELTMEGEGGYGDGKNVVVDGVNVARQVISI